MRAFTAFSQSGKLSMVSIVTTSSLPEGQDGQAGTYRLTSYEASTKQGPRGALPSHEARVTPLLAGLSAGLGNPWQHHVSICQLSRQAPAGQPAAPHRMRRRRSCGGVSGGARRCTSHRDSVAVLPSIT